MITCHQLLPSAMNNTSVKVSPTCRDSCLKLPAKTWLSESELIRRALTQYLDEQLTAATSNPPQIWPVACRAPLLPCPAIPSTLKLRPPMKPRVLLDTGPLVAFLHADDAHHQWAREQLRQLEAPILTCEAVTAKSCHLSCRIPDAPNRVLELIHRGSVQIALRPDPTVPSRGKPETAHR